MTSPLDNIDELELELSHLSTAEDKFNAIVSHLDVVSSRHTSVTAMISPGGDHIPNPFDLERKQVVSLFEALIKKHSLEDRWLELGKKNILANMAVAPLVRAPCANVNPAKAWACPNKGKLVCGVCKLVGYCSKSCQTTHWRTHKQDCKDPIRSIEWKPQWVVERRPPSFMSGDTGLNNVNWLSKLKPIALGHHLWGNVPAYDVLNLPRNENDKNVDLSLAFVASGDLRNIIQSVNGLPSDFTGKLTILLNDRSPYIVVRNIALLLLLGTVPDPAQAAELALHFWYSAFVPAQHDQSLRVVISELFEEVVKEQSFKIKTPLGPNSKLTGVFSSNIFQFMQTTIFSEYGIGDVSSELSRIRFEPSRIDRHHRWYGRLEPSHRLSALEFRRFGLVLPFGARNDHFNTPNRLLFSPDGKWLQDDLANPLESWDIKDVVDAGRVHGALRADLYGCLYFYLSDQLRTFAERIHRLQISFHMFDMDAQALPDAIRSGSLATYGFPSTTKFDRIDVSNILDIEYLGIPRTIAAWGPLLGNDHRAMLVGYFMNWVNHQKGGNLNTAPESATSNVTDQMIRDGRIPDFSGTLLAFFNTFMTYYDNSTAFEEYVDKQGTTEVLRQHKLKLKQKHTIVPHRFYAPLEASASALPSFADDETWYLRARVSSLLWSERFIEIGHA